MTTLAELDAAAALPLGRGTVFFYFLQHLLFNLVWRSITLREHVGYQKGVVEVINLIPIN